jgi:hypothetical protein
LHVGDQTAVYSDLPIFSSRFSVYRAGWNSHLRASLGRFSSR